MNVAPSAPSKSFLAASGALCAGIAVALAAYAAHAAAGMAQGLLQTAAALLFGHGLALAALARGAFCRRRRWAFVALLAGSVLFAGSVALHVFAQVPPRLAPTGGMLMIGGWLLLAFDLLQE
ncbi:MAG: DUF423 domain-containing protein [Lysobacter sp.]|nr:DUF423 domain-containing protein [Lysobacter sp.]